MDKIFTLVENQELAHKYNETLVQLYNVAGFKSYWLSNQAEMGEFETKIRRISKTCDYDYFTDGSMLDGVLLPQLNHVLKDSSSKKFVVIHLMGTHIMYRHRYPESFENFGGEPETVFPHKTSFQMINTYDNAVLYNDYFVDQVIQQLKALNTNASVLYLSDHGEDVYQTINEAMHSEAEGTKPMYDIPFVLWTSDDFKEERPDLIYDLDRSYSSEDLYHTMADIGHIRFSKFDSTKSIVNHAFAERERFILDQKKYEDVFGE